MEPISPVPGGIVWIVADQAGPGNDDEAYSTLRVLVAWIVVAEVQPQPNGTIRIIPGCESRYGHFANATLALQKLVAHSPTRALTTVEPYMQGDTIKIAGRIARRLCMKWPWRNRPTAWIPSRATTSHTNRPIALVPHSGSRRSCCPKAGLCSSIAGAGDMPESLAVRREEAPDPARWVRLAGDRPRRSSFGLRRGR